MADAGRDRWRPRRGRALATSAPHYTAAAAAERIIDRMWAELLGDVDDRHFFAYKASLYDQAMLCRLRLGWTASALETPERAKTRFLGDLIARRHAQS